MAGPYWFQAVTIALNVVQTVALAYVYTRWRRVNGQLDRIEARSS